MTEAARLVDELTPLLFTPFGTYRGRPQVACGACAKQADKPESVVHESDCPVYRLIRAEEANTAVIRANAEKIADLEDVRDDLEARVNALTAETEELRHLAMAAGEDADNWRAERDALARQVAALREALAEALHDYDHGDELLCVERLRAALAAAGGEGQRAGDNDRG